VKLAIWQPVTRPRLDAGGSRSKSRSQPTAASSTTDCAGDTAYSPLFWSQALVSQSAATLAGVEPPMTKPK